MVLRPTYIMADAGMDVGHIRVPERVWAQEPVCQYTHHTPCGSSNQKKKIYRGGRSNHPAGNTSLTSSCLYSNLSAKHIGSVEPTFYGNS